MTAYRNNARGEVAVPEAHRPGRRRPFEPIAVVGLLITLLLHGGAVVGIIAYRRAVAAAAQTPPPPSFVIAKLIRKGIKREKKHLPNKIVPEQSTQTVKKVDLTADAEAQPNKPKEKKRGELSDRQRKALDRIDQLAQGMKEIEAEGDPDGVVGGSSEAQDGDRYMTRIADLWNRTWSLPAVIPRERARALYVLLTLNIDREGNIKFPIAFDRRSGNDHFDNSVIIAWRQIKKLPLPPPDRMASIIAHGLKLKLNWEGMQ